MVNPVLALSVAIGLGLLTALLFWPRRGWYWRAGRALLVSERALLEDALKHLFDCEYQGHTCTLHSLTGALNRSPKRVAALLARLEELELASSTRGEYRLSAAGRQHALQIIRTHRLLESHLSVHTGVDAIEWHREAEHREHGMSPAEVERLSARLGHPRFDPHGDPIPTRGGEIRRHGGRPLADLQAGDVGRVVHVEDEPETIFAQLVTAGIHPGMQVRVIDVGADHVEFEADGMRHSLPPVVVANVAVESVSEIDETPPTALRLASLEPGEQARVTGFSPACRGMVRRRMLDLGIVPGTVIRAELRAIGGDPTAFRIRGAVVGLRREQAELIYVEPVADSEQEAAR